LVWVVCWACLLSSYSVSTNSQTPDPTTGNLVNFTGAPTATTGNWVNGVYVNQLCFHAGDPGNCGPYPSVQRTGNINFSYGGVNLYQVVNIQQALKAAGNNLQLTGFNFGFAAKNGNGWDDGRQDYLNAYVTFYRPDGGVAALYGYGQYTNRLYNWTNFNFSETFANPSLATSYRAAQYGFIGRDNNYWAGNYGPEITNVSFNLKYRVDPCATDPTSSPACPGYAAAMSAKTPTAVSTMDTIAASSPAIATVSIAPIASTQTKTNTSPPVVASTQSKSVALALSIIAKNQQQTQALETSVSQAAIAEAASTASQAQQQAVSVVAGLTAASQSLANSTAANTTTSNSNKSTTNATPVSMASTAVSKNTVFTAATTTTPMESFTNSVTDTVTIRPAAPVITSSVNTANTLPITRNTTATTNTSLTTANTLPIIKNTTATTTSDTVVTGIEMVVPKSTVSAISANVTTNTAPAPKNPTPTTVNITSANNTTEVSQSTTSISQTYSVKTQNQSSTPTIQTAVASTLPSQPPVNKTTVAQTVIAAPASTAVNQNNWTFSQSTADTQHITMTTAYIQPQNMMFYAMATTPVEQQQATAQPANLSTQSEIEQVNNSANFMTNRTDPLNAAVESKPAITTNSTTESTQTVKASVTDNELAGGVDINKMATTPVGYSNYTNLVLKDGKMYEPREIYKNQTTVDNARALRQLSTDRLHQQMIEQQYRR